MQNLVFTQLSVSEIRELLREELHAYFSEKENCRDEPEDFFDVLNIQEAADFLKLKKATVYALVSKSEIPYSKPSKRLYFSRQELTEWIKSNRRKTASEIRDAAGNYSPSPKR